MIATLASHAAPGIATLTHARLTQVRSASGTLADREDCMTDQEQQQLWQLRTKWLGIYAIALSDGVWSARRYDDPVRLLTADTADELDEQISLDYAKVVLST
jgi:hypothetical protein